VVLTIKEGQAVKIKKKIDAKNEQKLIWIVE